MSKNQPLLVDGLYKFAAYLCPDKKIVKDGNGIRIGNRGSIAITNDGKFYDHEVGKGGGLIDLIMMIKVCDYKTAIAVTKDVELDLVSSLQPRPRIEDPNDNKKKRTARALKIWSEATCIQNTLGERYFRHRCINIPLPTSLLFHTNLWYSEAESYPAVIAEVRTVDDRLTGIHIIYLNPKTGMKIAEDNAKKSIGIISKGAVRLSPLTESLTICEGIEDGLSLLQEYPHMTVWACLGTAGLINVAIPSSVKEVTIAIDNDEAGQKAAEIKSNELRAKGLIVHIFKPIGAKDFNEKLMRQYDVK